MSPSIALANWFFLMCIHHVTLNEDAYNWQFVCEPIHRTPKCCLNHIRLVQFQLIHGRFSSKSFLGEDSCLLRHLFNFILIPLTSQSITDFKDVLENVWWIAKNRVDIQRIVANINLQITFVELNLSKKMYKYFLISFARLSLEIQFGLAMV